MRLIDADALKAYIDMQEGRPFIGCTIGEAFKIMTDEQPTVQPEPHWIPVTERLPEKEGRYLVTNSKIGAWHVDVDFYRPYMGGWMYDQGVTACMPLPEPYKEVTE